jgi:hypothetical protein
MDSVVLRVATYDEVVDLMGLDMISVLSCARDALPPALDGLAPPDSMPWSSVERARATAGNGLVADELHAWPWAVQGNSMGFELLIADGLVMGVRFGTTHRDR